MAKASDIERSSSSTRHDDPMMLILQVVKKLTDESRVIVEGEGE